MINRHAGSSLEGDEQDDARTARQWFITAVAVQVGALDPDGTRFFSTFRDWQTAVTHIMDDAELAWEVIHEYANDDRDIYAEVDACARELVERAESNV